MTIAILMGVSGSGKTTVGKLVAERMGWAYLDADDYHSAANIAKMRAGEALTDDDRREWLEALAEVVREARTAGRSIVLGCSALKRAYRDMIAGGQHDDVLLVHLVGEPELIGRRMEAREHFMPPSNLGSQFDALEPPDEDERALVLDVRKPPAALADAVVREVRARAGGADQASTSS
jgi:gluconokinase